MFTSADEVLASSRRRTSSSSTSASPTCPVTAALQRAGRTLSTRTPSPRASVRRLLHPRVRTDPQVGHEADPRRHDGLRRPVPGGQDPQHRPAHRGAAHRRAVRRDPRQIAAKAEEYLRSTGSPTPSTSAPRPSSTSSTTCASSPRTTRLLPRRLRGGRLEHRPRGGGRQPRLQDAVQGRLLPAAAGRPLFRPAPTRRRPRGRPRTGCPL